ncbi:MAG: hypothetical protein M3321_10670 [Actinomycetota bacterium]|nr:hypothetical protein [Actinomycetota bacterium]
MTTDDPTTGAGLDYARRLYSAVVAWYDNADRKAQIILTANGGFVTVLTGFGLSRPDEIDRTVTVFGVETWLFAGLAAVSVVVAFASAAACLWSRLLLPARRDALLEQRGVTLRDAGTYDPSVLWFFQFVERLDERALETRLRALSPADEIDALADQAIQLARRVTTKHWFVNVGFAATALGLSSLLATAVSYVARLAA